MSYLLTKTELPDWFSYPGAFRRLVDQNLVDFSPWYILEEERVRTRLQGLKKRYPLRELMPFARRDDNDDVACWERGRGDSVIVIHDFASPGFEGRAEYRELWSWLKAVIDVMSRYEP